MKQNILLTSHLEYQRFWLVVGAVTVAVFLLEMVGVLWPWRTAMSWVTRPMLVAGANAVRIVRWPYDVAAHSAHSFERIQDLELRYAETIALVSELETLKKENQSLRELLGNAEAGPVSSTGQQTVETIIGYGQPLIYRSQPDVVVPGAMVLIANTLVGRIGEVGTNQAEVVLLSRSGSSGVLAQTESGIAGIVSGDGREVFLTEVPIQAEVKPGEKVTTVGQPGIQPGIYVGTVRSVQKVPHESTQRVVVDQLISFYESRVVQVRK